MANNASVAQEERPFTLVTLPPGPVQERFALAVVLALAVCLFVLAGPLSSVQLDGVPNFRPALVMPLVMTEAITGMLLYAQFSIVGSVALVVLAIGYLFNSLTLAAWLLALPGVFSPGELVGAGLQSGLWIGMMPRVGFPLFVIAYALLKDANPTMRAPEHSPSSAIAASLVIVPAAVCAATILLIAYDALLPRIMLDPTHFSSLFGPLTAATVLLIFTTLVVVWYKRRSVLDLWLIVVMWAHASGAESRSPVDLNKLIAEALSFLRYDLQKHGVKTEVESIVQPAYAVGDAVQLRQVLLNLMTNAIEAMGDANGLRILSVRVEVADGSVLA